MEIRILGPLEVIGDDGDPIDVGGARPRTLLLDLALAHGNAVPAEQLLEDIWPDAAPARNSLQVHVSRLRRVLGEQRIATRGGGYALELPRDALDAARFDQLAADGRAALHAGDAARAAETLRDALALWRGAALGEFADSGFARPVITRLEESRFAAIEDRVEADLLLGRHEELVGELEALLQDHPLRERLWAQLMLALYRGGRQGEALRAYQRARTVLSEELGIDPGPELKRLEAAVLAQDPELTVAPVSLPPAPGPGARPTHPTNLAAATNALIGRATEVDATASLVRRHRVVTVVGPGGVGKTRLAMEVGRALLGEFDDGVFFADLASVGDPSDVIPTLAVALGVETELGVGAATGGLERLGEFLADRALLLVVDNCEHVIGEAARVVEHLLGRCATVRVLATSREPLMIAGEGLWPLAPLDLEAAAALFESRPRAVVPAYDVDEGADTVRDICVRLDCLPLAIELAAARMRAFTPAALLARLDDRFRLLTVGQRTAFARQQTLRAVIDWSYDLLFETERRVFERVSVFAGNFSVAAAEAVGTSETVRADDVAEVLGRLVDKSLVSSHRTGDDVQFRLLQTLAQYGRERLEASGDGDATRARHAQHIAAAIEVSDPSHGDATGDWFGIVGRSLDDIRTAMEWAIAAGDADVACALGGGLGWNWNMGGRIDDTWRWLVAAVSLGEPEVPARRVRALAWAGMVGVAYDGTLALEYGAEAMTRAHAIGDAAGLGLAGTLHGSVLIEVFQRIDEGIAAFREAITAFRAVDDAWSRAMIELLHGAIALVTGDYDDALPKLRAGADGFAAVGNAWGRAIALRHLADIATARGRYDDAERALRDAIAGLQSVGAVGVATGLTARLGHVCALLGDDDEADVWFERALTAAERQRYVPTLALAHNLRGIARRRQGRLDEAEASHQHALTLYRDRGAHTGLSLTLASLGYVAELRGDATSAHARHRESLDAASAAGDRSAQALALEGLAGAASLAGDGESVGRLLGAAAALRERAGGLLVGQERIDVDRALARVDDNDVATGAFAAGYADAHAVVEEACATQTSSPR